MHNPQVTFPAHFTPANAVAFAGEPVWDVAGQRRCAPVPLLRSFVRARVPTYGSGTVSAALSQKTQMAPIFGVSACGWWFGHRLGDCQRHL